VRRISDRGIESQGRLTAHESGGLAAFQDEAPDSRTILQNRARRFKSPMIGKQRWFSDKSLNLSRTAEESPGKTGVAFYPDILDPGLLQPWPKAGSSR